MKWPANKKLMIITLVILGMGITQAVSWYRNQTDSPTFLKKNFTIGILSDTNLTMPNYQAIVDIASDDINYYLSENDIECNLSYNVQSTQRDMQTNMMAIRDWYLSNISLVIGPPWNFMVGSTIAYTMNKDMVVLGPGSSFPGLAMDDNLFRLTVPDDKEGKVLAEILNRRGYDYAISIERDDLWGTQMSNEFERNFNGETHRVKYDPRDVNLTKNLTYVDSILSEYSDSRVAVCAFSHELGSLINQSAKYERLSNTPWFTVNQEASLEMIMDTVDTTRVNVNLTTYTLNIPESVAYQRIMTQYHQMTGDELDLKMLYVYDSCWLYMYSIIETGSDNATEIKATLPLVASEYGGVCGVIEFDKYGDRDKAQYKVYSLFTESGRLVMNDMEEFTLKFSEIARESADLWKANRG